MKQQEILHCGLRTATLEDVGAEDLVRFSRFAYMGDYTVPQPNTTAPSPPQQGLKVDVGSNPLDYPPDPYHYNKRKPDCLYMPSVSAYRPENKRPIDTLYNQKKYCPKTPHLQYLEHCEFTSVTASDQVWKSILLAHARVYFLADKYGVTGLASLSLHRLHAILKDFTICTTSVGLITALIKQGHRSYASVN